jgi:2-hydroxychromene-2-carboxylate isomerase
VKLKTLIASALVSDAARDAARLAGSARRRLSGARPSLSYFHQIDDPYSHLTAQVLVKLAQRYDVAIEGHLVPPPRPAAAPERERLDSWSLRDAARVAAALALDFPADAQRPQAQAIDAAERALAPSQGASAFLSEAIRVGEALWAGRVLPDKGEPATEARAQGEAKRAALGHYLGATVHFEGEWFWGVDRLPYLEARLTPVRREAGPPLSRILREGERAPLPAPALIDFFFSFRSPYTYLAAERLRRLAEGYGATVRYRYILPMVMRGLPVPRDKSMYIVRDCKREADRLALPFGRIADPVGAGAERSLAVAHAATPLGLAGAFTECALRAAWAEGVDLASDAGLFGVAERAGLCASVVRAALADDSWRTAAEANRVELFELGLWGAPTMRVDGFPAHWGQDRLWAVEQDLRTWAERRGS